MRLASLYICTILIWGSTWLSIKYQTGQVPPLQSVFYRFMIAAVIMQIALRLFGKMPRFQWRTHIGFAFFGLTLFSLNYVLFYSATEMGFTTGLEAVIFSFMIVFIALYRLVLERVIPQRQIVIGGGIGIIGVLLLFGEDMGQLRLGEGFALGAILSVLATMTAAAGNLLSRKLQLQSIPVLAANGWGMSYGALILFVACLFEGSPFQFETNAVYVSNLLYLAIFGSVIAFAFYLTLLGEIGAERAAYVFVLVPFVALLLSSLFEGYGWSAPRLIGLVVVLIGNLIVMGKWPKFQRQSS